MATVQRCNGGFRKKWCNAIFETSVAPCNGATVQRCNGAMGVLAKHCQYGATVQRYYSGKRRPMAIDKYMVT